MKIYTKTGDDGLTGLYGGGRVRKDATRIEAYGTVDELNAVLGMIRASGPPLAVELLLERVQSELFDLGAELATPDAAARGMCSITPERTARLEGEIDRFETDLEPLKTFILPGGTPAAAALHLGRTVCRRAERLVVTLASEPAESQISSEIMVYLNRLSDLFFVLARWTNFSASVADVPWQKG